MSTAGDRARLLRKRHQRERQAVVFGALLAGLGVVGLGAAAVYTDVIPAPFLDRPFSTPEPTDTGSALPAPPCPTAELLPASYNSVTVNVLNASSRAGLAGQTSTDLAARGFIVDETGNSEVETSANEEIRFGEAGLAAAYTLASQLTDPVLVLDTRTDASVDLILGDTFPGLIDPTAVTLDPGTPLVGVAGCVALETALATAVPGPTATPEPTESATEAPAEDATTSDEPAIQG
ncbi:LytR C-terminal domain-containing protein [Actinotalea sp.]|uniref:LytR C-terminal domain-containing protein n=1 Tax=Actinotalea sp. TaxID=1872145 RepID=UPI00356B313E